MRVSVIIVSAGSGSRLGADVPKAFVQLGGMTLLARSLRIVAEVASASEVVITVPTGMEAAAREEVNRVGLALPVKIIAGGAERQDSVRIALTFTSAEAELVVIHDAARPFATPAMFRASLDEAARVGGAIVALPLADTLKRVDQERITETVPRARLWLAQTPQAFQRRLLIEAHERAVRERMIATDDADLIERTGGTVSVVNGSPLNLKITTADDLRLAEAIVRSRSA
ncbi:MAG TPA: 2-C-methyl-D-erythritol 4-phosphate cytidylyltransferase [Candidatus Binataceae bacterium]|nr:2-C-methyl-D-erythritol 4-phosphate cytidylyltransferase [Candidatus Binataceae bacterium]